MSKDKEHIIIAKDPSYVESIKVRANGMVRICRKWIPLTTLDLTYTDSVLQYLDERKRTALLFPNSYNRYQRLRLSELSDEGVLAVTQFMNLDGAATVSQDDYFWYAEVSMNDMKSYIGSIAMKQGYEGFEEYHQWYMDNIASKEPDRGVPPEAATTWPVIIGSFFDEGLQDGQHRFHHYVEAGMDTIPVIGFVDEYSYIKKVVDAWTQAPARSTV